MYEKLVEKRAKKHKFNLGHLNKHLGLSSFLSSSPQSVIYDFENECSYKSEKY